MRNLCFPSQRLAFTANRQIRESSRRLISSRPTSSKRNEDLCLDSAHFSRGRFRFCGGGPAAAPLEFKNKSTFATDNTRNPFWPIGWKPAARTAEATATEHSGPEISSSAFLVTSITLGRYQSVRHRERQGHAGRATIRPANGKSDLSNHGQGHPGWPGRFRPARSGNRRSTSPEVRTIRLPASPAISRYSLACSAAGCIPRGMWQSRG